jgi:GDP-L-fucose synthase
MKIFITGGSGFLGSHWVTHLNSLGYEVTAPNSKECNLRVQTDLNSFTKNFDLILHLAAWTQAGEWCLTHPGEQWLLNQQINYNILDWWLNHQPQAKVIGIGTSCSYDPTIPLTEENYLVGKPDNSLLTYAYTKRMLYQGMVALSSQFSLDFLHLIPATLYGNNYASSHKQKHFIFDLIDKINRGKKLNETVELWGDGYQRRELTYVQDFINNSMELITKNTFNESFNLGSNQDYTIREFAQLICDIVDYDFDKIVFNESKFTGVRKKLLDSSKAINLLSNYQISNLQSTLRDIVDSRSKFS